MEAISVDSYYLGIGDMVLGMAPASIVTVLGSCVAITMCAPSRELGAICHAALPKCKSAQECFPKCGQAGKHVECAVRVMLKQFDRQCIPRKDIQVKIFGGANMFSQLDKKDSVFPVGSLNDEVARRVIREAGLKIMATDTGGYTKRKIIFDISTGKVIVERPGGSFIQNTSGGYKELIKACG